MTRGKKLKYNTVFSLLYQGVMLLSSFILPRYFLNYYGSEANGLLASITQFLGFISLAECGVGAVVESTLYKPLAEKNEDEISRIIISAEKFFRKIAYVLIAYTAILMLVYPIITLDSFGYMYTMSLVVIISFSSFIQYYFSITYTLLLNADSMAFIPFIVRSVTAVLNVVLSICLIKNGAGIQIVKFGSSIVFLMQPLILNWYVRKNYKLDKKLKLTCEPIKQKWNGLIQHLAAVVLGNTDAAVLTVFSTLENVSIYSVYNLVVYGLKQVMLSLTAGIQPMFGNMYAKKEIDTLDKTFSYVEWILHTLTAFVFTCSAILIVPFVQVYTKGINDANYIVPVFAILICAAQGVYCIRLPYNMMVLAAGHYKQTQMSALIEMSINIIVSILLVIKFGLVGVAIGTLIAMMYRTCYLAWYLSKNIINRNIKFYIKHIAVDILSVVIMFLIGSKFKMSTVSYFSWIKLAVLVSGVNIFVVILINFVFYRLYMKQFIKMCLRKG